MPSDRVEIWRFRALVCLRVMTHDQESTTIIPSGVVVMFPASRRVRDCEPVAVPVSQYPFNSVPLDFRTGLSGSYTNSNDPMAPFHP